MNLKGQNSDWIGGENDSVEGKEHACCSCYFFLAIASTLFLNSCGGRERFFFGIDTILWCSCPFKRWTPIPNFKTRMVVVKNGSGGNDITKATVIMNGVQLLYNAVSGQIIAVIFNTEDLKKCLEDNHLIGVTYHDTTERVENPLAEVFEKGKKES